jgi:hypothetical protein
MNENIKNLRVLDIATLFMLAYIHRNGMPTGEKEQATKDAIDLAIKLIRLTPKGEV